MNTNNRNNNRRRGRNNNRGQGGGGNQGNRIDSRARGNAAQLLEKYRKLAHDASLNGDRVQTEYYLQFADHYFRVLADSKALKDEQRGPRQHEREPQGGDDFYDDEDEFETRGRRQEPRREREFDRDEEDEFAPEGQRAVEGEEISPEDEADNPFLRENRQRRPRNRGRERSRGDEGREAAPAAEDDGEGNGFDAGILPPSIARDEAPAAPKRAPRPRKAKKAEDGDAEALEAVG